MRELNYSNILFYVCQAFFKTFFRFFSLSFYWTQSVLVLLVSHSSVIISYLILAVKRFSQLFLKFFKFLFRCSTALLISFATACLSYHNCYCLVKRFSKLFSENFLSFWQPFCRTFCLSPVLFTTACLSYHI